VSRACRNLALREIFPSAVKATTGLRFAMRISPIPLHTIHIFGYNTGY
jgi:hypothetical protein